MITVTERGNDQIETLLGVVESLEVAKDRFICDDTILICIYPHETSDCFVIAYCHIYLTVDRKVITLYVGPGEV